MKTSVEPNSRLARRLTAGDAMLLGLGSMIGAGIFAAAGPAALAAGSGILIAVGLAGAVSYLNATTMAQLAAVYPESGGAYAYGRRVLSPFAGFLAGWGFVFGKIASCTAMALTFAHYAAPQNPHVVAVVTVLALTWINYLGVKKTAAATKILVTVVLLSLAVIVVAAVTGGDPEVSRLSGFFDRGGVTGILEAAGIMFFAFAGYARVATLGEEVIEPHKNIPKAIMGALGATIVVYLVVITTTLLVLPVSDLMQSTAPLALAVERTRFEFLSPLVRAGAAIASLSVLLSLLAGISRTVFAMAANGDLPAFLSAIHPKHKVPHRAEIIIGVIVAVVVSGAGLRSAIGFSSFAILAYYAIANAAALRLPVTSLLYPKGFAVVGLIICLVLAMNLPIESIVGGSVVFFAGATWYLFSKTALNSKL